MQVAFIINSNARSGFAGMWLTRNRRMLTVLAHENAVWSVHSDAEIRDAVGKARSLGCTLIVAGGGDGTVSTVAGCLSQTGVALGVLPLGTLNHFARDLGIPADLDAALALIRRGCTTPIDLGEVNGKPFLNNSSIGLYPDLVRDREKQQTRLGRGKWVAFCWALLGVLRRFPFLDVRLVVGSDVQVRRTPFVFVGNNAYAMEGFNIGARAALTGAELSVYVTHRTSRSGLFHLGINALLGRLRQVKDFYTLLVPQLTIETRRKRIRVAIDGEVHILHAPLHFRSLARALQVVVDIPPNRSDRSS